MPTVLVPTRTRACSCLQADTNAWPQLLELGVDEDGVALSRAAQEKVVRGAFAEPLVFAPEHRRLPSELLGKSPAAWGSRIGVGPEGPLLGAHVRSIPRTIRLRGRAPAIAQSQWVVCGSEVSGLFFVASMES